MKNKIAIIGGDLRMIKLAKLLAKEEKIIYTYGLETAEEIKEQEKIIECQRIEEVIKNAETIIGPIPFSKDGENIHAPFSQREITIKELIQKLEQKTLIVGSIRRRNKKNIIP